ncbi:hypothetical protein RvY_09989 [Ramazzottius varieornatus]|uniref:EF-hand domain-containing protein n=1 Tax=Ramazzottius varieornatus TaxID=947166 RepID=A0A1D1VJ25_RAMVA|nr:hypothetical protein RvY_09989 [Ramazzottius varieornatus]
MTEQLSDKQVANFKQAFVLFDKDGNGIISPADLASAMKSLGLSPTEANLQDMINEVDIDGDGSVEFSEFLRMMVRKMKQVDLDDELRVIFNLFDKDRDGFLNVKDLSIVLASLGEKLTDAEVKELIVDFDLDGDNMINYHEFVHMMS